MKRLNNQIALVTGAATGLGKAIAHCLAREGAHVVLADRDEPTLKKVHRQFAQESLDVSYHPVDVAHEDSVKQLAQHLAEQYSQLDIVVNSAGVVGPNGRKITDVSLEEYEQTYRVNLRGSFLMTKHSLPLMQKHNYGRILLIASIAGKEGNAGMCAYSSTKAGVIGLVKSVGKEFAETGITVNGLAPAVIRTTMVENMNPEQVTYMTDKIPMKRCGTLDEVAALVAFVVSKENAFTTGFTYDMSGGRATY